MTMECSICGRKNDTTKCKECERKYCHHCGDPIEELCEFCLEEEEW